jgi:MOSC domain-containing protein YiiM
VYYPWGHRDGGDRVYDVRNHGGPDQAVYAYAREDLDRWAAELGRETKDRASRRVAHS